MKRDSKGPRGGRPLTLRSIGSVGELGSPPRSLARLRARTVEGSSRPHSKDGRDGSRSSLKEDSRMESHQSELVVAGIDVSKAKLDVAVGSHTLFSVPNTREGLEQLIPELKRLKVTQVVLEATGGLEILCVAMLAAAGLAPAV